MKTHNSFTLEEAQQELAKGTNQRVWEMLEKSNRTPAEEEDMLLAAYTSLYLWKEVGTAVQVQRGCWLAAKAHIALDQSEDAVHWAEKCLQITEENPQEMEDFDLAFAQEVLARAYALAGDLKKAQEHRSRAVVLGEQIQDPEDREIFWSDFQAGSWYLLDPE